MAVIVVDELKHDETGVAYSNLYATIQSHISSTKSGSTYTIKSLVKFYNSQVGYTAGNQEIWSKVYSYTTESFPTSNICVWFYTQFKAQIGGTITDA